MIMSGGNIACSIGNQIGNGSGEMKFEIPSKDASSIATCIATEIVNEILDSALDLATLKNAQGESLKTTEPHRQRDFLAGLECDTIAFSVDDGLCQFTDVCRDKKENLESPVGEEITGEHPDIKEIIDGLSSIHMPEKNTEELVQLDVEMKRLLSEMMSPPYDIVNYETLPRKNGVGDQPVEDVIAVAEEVPTPQSDECLVDPEKTKIVEKKTRVTDLVMNSKQVLSEFLMSEETKKKQDEWEESNEKVLQVIELDQCNEPIKVEGEEEVKTQENEEAEEFTTIPIDECMETIELGSAEVKIAEKGKALEGKGNDSREIKPGSSHSQAADVTDGSKELKSKSKFELFMKRKWNFNLKIFGIGKKKRQMEKDEKTAL